LPADEKFTGADVRSDRAPDGYTCPPGQWLTLEARRPKRGHTLSHRDAADEADGGACLLREQGLHTAETRRQPLAVWGENGQETCSQQMIATIDTLAARKMYGLRLAIVEPVGEGDAFTEAMSSLDVAWPDQRDYAVEALLHGA
jgi:hypothetical protein